MNLLDEQLNRWSALRILLVSLPLTAPLDQYRISSGYGSRKDPVNGRKAQHRAVDFAAPSGAPIYATAPGKIRELDYVWPQELDEAKRGWQPPEPSPIIKMMLEQRKAQASKEHGG